MAQGIVCKGCALHQQSKVPGPSGIVVKLELGDQVSPRPAVGEGGTASIDDWTLLNAGAALYVAGQVTTLIKGVDLARSVVESGVALSRLEQFVKATQALALEANQ